MKQYFEGEQFTSIAYVLACLQGTSTPPLWLLRRILAHTRARMGIVLSSGIVHSFGLKARQFTKELWESA